MVKLGSRRWGELRLGREWTPVFLGWVYSDPFIAVGVGSSANFFSASTTTALSRAFGSALNPTTISRSSNAIQYWTPSGWGGFYAQAMVAAGEGSNSVKAVSNTPPAGQGWRNATFDAAGYFGNTRIDAQNTDLKQAGAYAAWNPGYMRLAASVTESKFLTSKQINYILGLNVPIGVHLIPRLV